MIPNSFFEAAQALGSEPSFAQGAGGNLSYKDGDVMYVKASGCLLRQVAHHAGYVACCHEPIARYLAEHKDAYEPRSHTQENEFNRLIESTLIPAESFGVPSIETGMHAILARAAIHTHSVYANAIGCIQDGAAILRNIFADANIPIATIPYVNPGLALANALFIEKQEHGALPTVIFLLNHGMITHAETIDEALQLMLRTDEMLRAHLAKKQIPSFRVNDEKHDFSHHLFPDSVVYASINFAKLPPEKISAFHEISSASRYIVQAISAQGGTPNFFDPRDVDFILNMDREKHRIAMVRET